MAEKPEITGYIKEFGDGRPEEQEITGIKVNFGNPEGYAIQIPENLFPYYQEFIKNSKLPKDEIDNYIIQKGLEAWRKSEYYKK